ncbi:MAG: hypothetical protein K5866_08900 [Treponema sp.]|nr:hypothetical protein [Treponema sp.]
MKKRIYLLLSLLLVFLISSCSHILENSTAKLDEVDVNEALKENVSNGKYVNTIFDYAGNTVLNTQSNYFDNTLDSNTVIKLDFTLNVDESSVSDAIEIYQIDTSAYEAGDIAHVYKRGDKLTYTSYVRDSSVYVSVNLKDVSMIQLLINPSLKAKNGQLFDYDNDYAQGETNGDDSYFIYYSASTFDESTIGGVEARSIFNKELNLNNLSIYDDYITFSFSGLVEGFSTDEIVSAFSSKLILQKYTSSGWADVSTAITYESSKIKVTPASIDHSCAYRAIINNPNDLIVTDSVYGDYRYSYDANVKMIVVSSRIVFPADDGSAYDQRLFDSITLSIDNQYRITSFTYEIYAANQASASTDTNYTHFVGFDDLASNIVILDQNKKEVSFGEIKETVLSTSYIGPSSDRKTFNRKVTCKFDKPVFVGKSAYIYAKPTLGLQYVKHDDDEWINDFTSPLRVALGYSQDPDDLMANNSCRSFLLLDHYED